MSMPARAFFRSQGSMPDIALRRQSGDAIFRAQANRAIVPMQTSRPPSPPAVALQNDRQQWRPPRIILRPALPKLPEQCSDRERLRVRVFERVFRLVGGSPTSLRIRASIVL